MIMMMMMISTVQTLEERMNKHKKDARANLKGTLIGKCSSNELVLRPGCKIELVEDFPCSSKQELERREGWYQLNNPCVNKNIAGRTEQEYYAIGTREYRCHCEPIAQHRAAEVVSRTIGFGSD